MANDSAQSRLARLQALTRPWRWLFRQRGNGLRDDTWVPVIFVDSAIVGPLLAELRRASIPAYCVRVRPGWRMLSQPGRWCVWAGCSAYPRAEQHLAATVTRLARSVPRGPIGLAGNR